MASGGYITRGLRAQREMPVKERIYLYCKGRKNKNITGGWTKDGYTNEINGRAIMEPIDRIAYPTSYSTEGVCFEFTEPSSQEQSANCMVYGTEDLINTDLRRYLVIEMRAFVADAGDFAVKLSRTKELEDDGQYNLVCGTEWKKHFIDLREEGNLSGGRYVVLTAGLQGWSNPSKYQVRRVYMTDIKEEDVITPLYNRGDTYINTVGWETSEGSPTFANDAIELFSTGEYVGVRTLRKVNVNGVKGIGIQYEGIDADKSYGFGAELKDDQGHQIWNGSVSPSNGANILYMSFVPSVVPFDRAPLQGSYKLNIHTWNSVQIKIKAVWLF